ncbi:hypothetical protein C0Q70_16487 [Pomacea canaliculata]|uniref:Uncharacterized protein n=1 Tax=Pomacea canaliculata TaxID=400727 RepID=A0A2T7NPX5_POMCA|nr:hypothetical protein C0Q70_16487 [Pomacea canaliculata]
MVFPTLLAEKLACSHAGQETSMKARRAHQETWLPASQKRLNLNQFLRTPTSGVKGEVARV